MSISNVHMRLIFQVSDDSSGYPKYRTLDIPMSDRMIDIMAETKSTCAVLVGGHVVQEDEPHYEPLATELERAKAEIERLRAGYAECIGELASMAQPPDFEVTRRMQLVRRHRDILTGDR